MKRKNGEGTWGEKNINGIKYKFFRDPSGHYTYGKTIKEVNEKIENKKKHSNITAKSKTLSFKEYSLEWLYKSKSKKIKQQTYDNYELLLETSLGKISDMNVKSLNDDVIQSWLNDMADNYSLGTIRKIWSIVRQCIKYGATRDELPKINLELIYVPSEENVMHKRKSVEFATIHDVDALYKEAFRTKDYGYNNFGAANSEYVYGNNARAIIIIMYTGVRTSELCALKWGNVDMKNKIITISETHAVIKNRDSDDTRKSKIINSSPKQYRSRDIPLSGKAYEQFVYFESLNPNHSSNDYVCISKNNTPLTRRNIARTLSNMLSRCDANPNLTPHSLRHGFGSILLEKGVEIKTISELMGHADIRTTYNIYIGITEDQKKKAIEKLD